MATEKRLIAFDPITFESFTRHATKYREPDACQYDMGYVDAVDQIGDWLDANTVDAVEVVRCRDCKHFWKSFSGTHSCKLHKGLVGTKYDTYCSYGERKDND